jgi:hypothetical protein
MAVANTQAYYKMAPDLLDKLLLDPKMFEWGQNLVYPYRVQGHVILG